MSTEVVSGQEIRVIVSKGHLAVEMMVPAGFSRDLLSEALCLGLLQQSGVDITASVASAVRAMIADPPPPGEYQRTLLAEAALPEPGQDGRVEWFVTEPTPGESQNNSDDGDSDQEAANYYDRSHYLVVKAGDVIGRIIEPTCGSDGRDVLGQTIPAKLGRAVPLEMDESVARDRTGQIVVQCDGVLCRDEQSVCVRQILEVNGCVDFSTGNINFIGNVLVAKGVRDCFVVEATGSVEVGGLIEAARINCGTDLVARSGMAGRERGFVNVGGNLMARYLDNVQGEILGNLEVKREVINCELTVHGAIQSPTGTLIGGRIVVTGAVEVVAVGSGAGVSTELVLGSVPKLEPVAAQLEKLVEQLTIRRDEIEVEQKLMTKNARLMSSTDKERQTELTFEYQATTEKLAEGQAAKEKLTARIKQCRTVDLTVHRTLFQGVIVTVGKQSYKIRSEVSGPIWIGLDANGTVIYRQGGTTGPLSRISYLKAVAV